MVEDVHERLDGRLKEGVAADGLKDLLDERDGVRQGHAELEPAGEAAQALLVDQGRGGRHHQVLQHGKYCKGRRLDKGSCFGEEVIVSLVRNGRIGFCVLCDEAFYT